MPAKLSLLVRLSLVTIPLTTSAADPADEVNAIGYVNKTLLPGFNLVASPLLLNPNTIETPFDIQGSALDGFRVFFMKDGVFVGGTYDAETGTFDPPGFGAEPITPGRAFYVFNPLPTDAVLTFAGEVLLGTNVNPLPAGFSAVSSSAPESGTLTQLNFPKAPGDIVYLWDAANRTYRGSIYDDLEGAWLPKEPKLEVADGFILWKNQPTNWVQHVELTTSAALNAP